MSLGVNYEISLDFIENTYVMIRAREADLNSRKIIVHCTDEGKEFVLTDSMDAVYELRKPDDTVAGNDATINLEDNVIEIDLSKQSLLVPGIVTANVVVRDHTSSAVLGTMDFYIQIMKKIISKEEVISSNEFDSLSEFLIQMEQDLDEINANEELRKTAEQQRIADENTRQANESDRQEAETARAEAEEARADAERIRADNEEDRQSAETARDNAEDAREKAETGRVSAETSRVSAEEDREDAEAARENAETLRQQNTQAAIDACEEIEETLETKLANREFDGSEVLFGEGVPSSSTGRDDDIYINTSNSGEYPHYLFTRTDGVWTPRFSMQTMNGEIINSLSGDSTADAPSIHAVKEALNGKANNTVATSEANGIMSSTDKANLDALMAWKSQVEAGTISIMVEISEDDETVDIVESDEPTLNEETSNIDEPEQVE